MPATTLALRPPATVPTLDLVPEPSDAQLAAAEMALATAGLKFDTVSASGAASCPWCGGAARPLAA